MWLSFTGKDKSFEELSHSVKATTVRGRNSWTPNVIVFTSICLLHTTIWDNRHSNHTSSYGMCTAVLQWTSTSRSSMTSSVSASWKCAQLTKESIPELANKSWSDVANVLYSHPLVETVKEQPHYMMIFAGNSTNRYNVNPERKKFLNSYQYRIEPFLGSLGGFTVTWGRIYQYPQQSNTESCDASANNRELAFAIFILE